MQTWLVTGGAGFIGGNFVLEARRLGVARIINLDALTYAGNLDTLKTLEGDAQHVFCEGDIIEPRDRHICANAQPHSLYGVHCA